MSEIKRCDSCKCEIKMGEETVHYNGKIYCSLSCSDVDNGNEKYNGDLF